MSVVADDQVDARATGAESPDAEPAPNPHAAGTSADRADTIDQLTGLLGAVQAELGRVVAAADDAGDWRADGATDMAAWLVGTQALRTPRAREVVRVAHALEGLPALREALASGELSWDQVRPATTFATPADDTDLAGRLPGWSAAQVERLARRLRPRSADDDRTAHQRRTFGWRPDHQAGGFQYSGFLPADAAAQVNAALTALAEAAGPAPETGLWDPFGTRCADALHDLAAGSTADTLVTIHVEADVVTGATTGNGDVADVAIGRDAVLRHLCDTGVEHSVHGPDGTCIGIGRRSRSIPPWLRRSILDRDRTCRFPGCERAIRHVHHMQHWTRAGPTDSHNLAGHCWHHHHLVHEGGWRVEGDGDHEVTFIGPLGQRLASRRQPLRTDVRSWAGQLIGDASAGRQEGGDLQAPPTTPDSTTDPGAQDPTGTRERSETQVTAP